MIDRDTASRLGLDAQTIDNTLYDAFGQRQVSTVFTQLNEYHLVMEVAPEFQRNPDALKGIYVRSTNGTEVPLGCLLALRTENHSSHSQSSGAISCCHVSFNLAPGVALGEAVTAVNRLANARWVCPDRYWAPFKARRRRFRPRSQTSRF